MKKAIKYIFPCILGIIAIVFIVTGIRQFGFWNEEKGPTSGFYPTIVSVVLIIMLLVQMHNARKEKDPEFPKQDWLVIAAVASIFVASYLIGMIPGILIYLIVWLHWVEKRNWKMSLIFSFITIGVVYAVFGIWLQISFPTGLLFSFTFG